MNKEKQIEEMAWELCDIPRHPSIKNCEQCGNKHCHAIYYAKRAIKQGYRKIEQRYQVKADETFEMIPTIESVRQEVAREIYEELKWHKHNKRGNKK